MTTMRASRLPGDLQEVMHHRLLRPEPLELAAVLVPVLLVDRDVGRALGGQVPAQHGQAQQHLLGVLQGRLHVLHSLLQLLALHLRLGRGWSPRGTT